MISQRVTGNRVRIPSGPAAVTGEHISKTSHSAIELGKTGDGVLIREPEDLPEVDSSTPFEERNGVHSIS